VRKASIGLATLVLGLVAAFSYAQAPVPFINQPLVPDAIAPGGPDFTLTVNGTGFVSSSTVNWNGRPLATTFVNGSQLTAVVPAADVATTNTGWVTVVNPAPGGGTSNVVFLSITASTETPAFKLASSPATGTYPVAVAVGDFNGDGKLDLAVGNLDFCSDTEQEPVCEPGNISILLGDGDGNFALASSPATVWNAYSVAVGDFNGDGKLDLAAVDNYEFSKVVVLLGDGAGNFTVVSSPRVGYEPNSVATGDFNGDGKLDLATANSESSTVSILLGDGTGNFTLASSPATGSVPFSVAVGDFNGDGKLDLAVANVGDNTISILLGDGTGNFTLASSPATGSSPASVAVGDFNGDGKLDLATANGGSQMLSVMLGDGTGNFILASSPATGSSPASVAVGDFNGDGKLDLATANPESNTLSVMLGDGTGNFTLASSPSTGFWPMSVAVGDFNGDGKLDLAATNYCGSGPMCGPVGTVSVLLQVPPYPIVTLSPASLTFGAQLVFTPSAPQTVTLTNTGTATLAISSIVASDSFFELNNCGSSLAVGAKCNINVFFSPRVLGTVTGTVTITDNASDSPQTVSLSGAGTIVGLSPSTVNFYTQTVGTTSAAQTVTMTNYGYRAVNVGIGLRGSNPANFAQTNTCGNSLAAGASCSISVTFTPQAKGSRTATLDAVDNGGGSPQVVTLKGYGT